jgi:predicted transcriptional regulator
LRRQRRTQEHIAGELGISKATVSRILKRRLSTPERNCIGEPEQKSISTASKKVPDIGGLLAFAAQS